MDKDLHSGRVEDWDLFIHMDSFLYFTEEIDGETMVKAVYWVGDDGVDEINKRDLPIKIRMEDGNLVWERYSGGEEYSYRYDDRGKLIWERFPDGEEVNYYHG